MTTPSNITPLRNLEFHPYLNDNGEIEEIWQGKIGVYAIFDKHQTLQFLGYSRDIYLSLKQHLVRQPYQCYWLKIETVDRPNRTVLEDIRQAWINENGSLPLGNGVNESKWQKPIDATLTMTEAETQEYENIDDLGKTKFLKNVARRVESEIEAQLKERGVKMQLRFNPKLKEQGLLDLK